MQSKESTKSPTLNREKISCGTVRGQSLTFYCTGGIMQSWFLKVVKTLLIQQNNRNGHIYIRVMKQHIS